MGRVLRAARPEQSCPSSSWYHNNSSPSNAGTFDWTKKRRMLLRLCSVAGGGVDIRANVSVHGSFRKILVRGRATRRWFVIQLRETNRKNPTLVFNYVSYILVVEVVFVDFGSHGTHTHKEATVPYSSHLRSQYHTRK